MICIAAPSARAGASRAAASARVADEERQHDGPDGAGDEVRVGEQVGPRRDRTAVEVPPRAVELLPERVRVEAEGGVDVGEARPEQGVGGVDRRPAGERRGEGGLDAVDLAVRGVGARPRARGRRRPSRPSGSRGRRSRRAGGRARAAGASRSENVRLWWRNERCRKRSSAARPAPAARRGGRGRSARPRASRRRPAGGGACARATRAGRTRARARARPGSPASGTRYATQMPTENAELSA